MNLWLFLVLHAKMHPWEGPCNLKGLSDWSVTPLFMSYMMFLALESPFRTYWAILAYQSARPLGTCKFQTDTREEMTLKGVGAIYLSQTSEGCRLIASESCKRDQEGNPRDDPLLRVLWLLEHIISKTQRTVAGCGFWAPSLTCITLFKCNPQPATNLVCNAPCHHLNIKHKAEPNKTKKTNNHFQTSPIPKNQKNQKNQTNQTDQTFPDQSNPKKTKDPQKI